MSNCPTALRNGGVILLLLGSSLLMTRGASSQESLPPPAGMPTDVFEYHAPLVIDASMSRRLGSAELSLDVPSGAIVKIGGKRTKNRSWSRYRHFRINGLSHDFPTTVTVEASIRHDDCQCTYSESWCSCGNEMKTCCKTIELYAGDQEYLDFTKAAAKKEVSTCCDRDLPTETLAGYQGLPILAQVDGMELDDELLAPNSDDPAEDFTKAFQFEWTGHNDDIPLRCAITFAGEDFSLIDLEDNAQLALVSNFPYPESLLTPNSVRLAGSLDVSTGLDKAIKLAVVTLSLAEKDGGLHGSVATVDAVAADDFYTVLLNALKPQIRKGLFSSERKEIMAELGGHVWVEGELFPISRPLLIKLVIAD